LTFDKGQVFKLKDNTKSSYRKMKNLVENDQELLISADKRAETIIRIILPISAIIIVCELYILMKL